MTGICGLVGQGADDLEARANSILSSMRNRGANSRTFSRTLQSGEKVTMGVCNVTDAQSLAPQPVPLVLDGVFFGEDTITHKSGPAGPSRLIQTPGAFAFLTLVGDQLIAGRDIVGQKPLYFGETGDGVVAFASLRSPLVAIGIREPQAVPPGKLIRAAAGYYGTMSDYSLKQPEEEPIGESDATRTLNDLFVEAVARTVPRGAGIAFSGGLDSALVAYAGKSAGLEPELICVGMKGQQELDHAERTAKDFGLPIDIWELSASDVLNALPDVVSFIETTEPVIFGISVPLYLACQRAREMGLSFIAAGQLSDELFGGYGKFEEIALREGTGELGRAMFERVVGASAKDFDPGDKLAVAAGLELCSPFAYLPLVKYALTLPSSLRVNLTNGRVIRKYVLRRLAARMGLPESVVDRPKKAVQYSSGVQKVLLKEAKRRGISLGKMLESFTR